MVQDSLIPVPDTLQELNAEVHQFDGFLQWFGSLHPLWQGILVALIGGIILFLVALLFKPWRVLVRRLHRMRALHHAKYMVNYRDFYGDELVERHQYEYVSERKEMVESKEITRDIIRDAEQFLKGEKSVLVLVGTGGMGKSRILIELAKRHRRIRFVNTRGYDTEMEKQMEGLEQVVRQGRVLVFDDCQEYLGILPRLLDILQRRKARAIFASRYLEPVKQGLAQRRLGHEVIELGQMANVSQIVTEEEDVAESLLRISEGNPAIAVMAFEHHKRRKTLKGIIDSFGLMNEVLRDLISAGENAGCQNPTLFLAELAVRSGLWEADEPLKRNFGMVKELKKMGHLIVEQHSKKRLYYIAPDMLRDHIIRQVFFESEEISPEFEDLILKVSLIDSTNIVRMLGIQFRETEKVVYKRACAEVLKRFADVVSKPAIGFKTRPKRISPEHTIALGLEAYEWFGDYRLVSDTLGDFCAPTDKISSHYWAIRASGFYYQTGNLIRASECLKRASDLTDEPEANAVLLHNLGLIEQDQGNYEEAEKLYKQSQKINEELGNKSGIAKNLHQLGMIQEDQGNYEEAEKLYKQSQKINEELGNKSGIAKTLHQLGIIQQHQGNNKEAEKLYKQSLKINKELGYKSGIAGTLHQLGIIQQRQGNYEEAEKLYKQSLKINEELGDRSGIANTLHQLGTIQGDQGKYEEAEKLYKQSLKIKKELGDKSGIAGSLYQVGRIHLAREDYRSALQNFLIAASIAKELKHPNLPLALGGIKEIEEVLGPTRFKELSQAVQADLEKQMKKENE